MAALSFRRRPRKSSNPCRAWMNSIEDEFRFLPLIGKKVAFKKSCQHKDKRRMVRLARTTSMISLPHLDDRGLTNQEPLKKSCEKLTSEVETCVQRKMKISFQRKVVQMISIQDQASLQKEISTNANISPSQQQQQQQQQLPLVFRNYVKELGATGDPVLVIQKQLFSSDVNPGHQRLSIPVKQVVNHGFLTEEERSRFNSENKQEEIDAILIEPSLAQSRIKFKKWKMGKTEIYVLVSGWNKVVERNGLETGQVVQLWSFKKGLQLHFILVRL